MSEALRFPCPVCGEDIVMVLCTFQIGGLLSWDGKSTSCPYCLFRLVWRARQEQDGAMLWLEEEGEQ